MFEACSTLPYNRRVAPRGAAPGCLQVRVIVNGKEHIVADGQTMAGLLATLALEPIRVAVEVNRELVSRRDYAQTPLREGDRVEIVTFVGGG